MATKPPAAPRKPVKRPGPADDEREYYIVNPKGAVHSCDRAHAFNRLKQLGYRLATPAEIAKYHEQDVQDFRYPIALPWSPDPDVQLAALETAIQSQQ